MLQATGHRCPLAQKPLKEDNKLNISFPLNKQDSLKYVQSNPNDKSVLRVLMNLTHNCHKCLRPLNQSQCYHKINRCKANPHQLHRRGENNCDHISTAGK